MKQQEIAERLHVLRLAMEAQGGATVSDMEAPLSLALFDVMNALGLPTEAQVYVLGADNALRMREEYGIDWEEMG